VLLPHLILETMMMMESTDDAAAANDGCCDGCVCECVESHGHFQTVRSEKRESDFWV